MRTNINIKQLLAWCRQHRNPLLLITGSVAVGSLLHMHWHMTHVAQHQVEPLKAEVRLQEKTEVRRQERLLKRQEPYLVKRKVEISLTPQIDVDARSTTTTTPTAPAEPTHDAAPVPGAQTAEFPAFGYAVHPVWRVPNWGAMRTPAEWNRHYSQMTDDDYVSIPSYNLANLMVPLDTLMRPFREEHIPLLTAKLYYSTRHFGAYHLDSGEFEAMHPGVDLKLAHGTPVGSIAGGRVYAVSSDTNMGRYVIVEHRVPGKGTYFSLYGHLDETWVTEGQDVTPGQAIGTVGMTGNTTAPHVHLQVDRDLGGDTHKRYWPTRLPSVTEANQFTVHPIRFIAEHSRSRLAGQ